jgi:hypothetical protein
LIYLNQAMHSPHLKQAIGAYSARSTINTGIPSTAG